MNNLDIIQNILYNLKCEYGSSIVLYRHTETILDPKSGENKPFYQVRTVRKAIVLPATLERKEHSNVQGLFQSKYNYATTNLILGSKDVGTVTTGDIVLADEIYYIVTAVTYSAMLKSFLVELTNIDAYDGPHNIDLTIINTLNVSGGT